MAKVQMKYARLVRGQSFTMSNQDRRTTGKVFKRGEWAQVTPAEVEYLTANAIDNVTVSGGGEVAPTMENRQKFEFSSTKPGDEAVRQRSR